MVTVDNKLFIQEYLEAISGKEKTPAVVKKYVADPELMGHIAFFEAAFPKYEILVDDFICEEDKVVIRARGKAVHKGDLMGIPPTGKTVEIPFIAIYQVADQKIVKGWLVTDRMQIMEQLGVRPGDN